MSLYFEKLKNNLTFYKKAAILAAAVFFGSICAGYALHEVTADQISTQIENAK